MSDQAKRPDDDDSAGGSTAAAGEVHTPGSSAPGTDVPESSVPGSSETRDGIEMLDQPIPSWWKRIFVVTLALAIPYFVFYHSGAEGRSLEARYASAAAENARLQFAEIGELEGDAMTLAKYKDEASWLRVGQSVFASHCAACHGTSGEGLVGPNLRDEHYKNVRRIDDIFTVINNGAGSGAMPGWKDRLQKNERVLVAAYVASLRGTDPEGTGKGAEGREIPPWPEYVAPEPEEESGDPPQQTGPAAEQTGPAAEQTGPAAEQTGPAAEQTGPAAEQTGPAAEQTGQDAEQTGSDAEQTG